MKRTILLIGLGVAFLGVSAWVLLSGGRSAKAVRAKFRLGGAILTIVGLTSLASCGDGGGYMVDCYDPVPAPYNLLQAQVENGVTLRNGDIIIIDAYCEFETEATIAIYDTEDTLLQRERLTLEKGYRQIEFTISVGEYRGEAVVVLTYLSNSSSETEERSQYNITIEE